MANSRHRATQDIGQVKHVKDNEGNTLRDAPAILQRWSDYFAKISNDEFPHMPIQSAHPVSGPIMPITTAEVEAAIKKMKNGKTMDAIHAARLLVERSQEKNRRIHVTFLDFENAFNKILSSAAKATPSRTPKPKSTPPG
ncbi:MAG: hypothetical protein ACRCUF_12565 [Aeromonas sobria]